MRPNSRSREWTGRSLSVPALRRRVVINLGLRVTAGRFDLGAVTAPAGRTVTHGYFGLPTLR